MLSETAEKQSVRKKIQIFKDEKQGSALMSPSNIQVNKAFLFGILSGTCSEVMS